MSHSHTSGADLSTAPKDHRRKLWIAFGLTAAVAIAQAVGSVMTGSLALLTDTVHMVTDAAGLLVALIAATLMLKPASGQRTWGFRRIEVLAALGQATLLLVIGIYALIEGIRRLGAPPEVPAGELLIFGIIGLVANVASLIVLSSARGENMNMRAAFLEVLNDALGSLGVIAAAIVMATTGFQQADAIAALFIAVLILPRAVTIIRESVRMLMEFTPDGLNMDALRESLLDLEHVVDVHHLHASTVATGLPRLTAHLVVADTCFSEGCALETLQAAQDRVAEKGIEHATFQIETLDVASQESACEA